MKRSNQEVSDARRGDQRSHRSDRDAGVRHRRPRGRGLRARTAVHPLRPRASVGHVGALALRRREAGAAAPPTRAQRRRPAVRAAPEPPVDLDRLVARWRVAFDAAQTALRAASLDLPAGELRDRGRALADERDATARLIQAVAHERGTAVYPALLTATSAEAKRVLALPAAVTACVFNLD